jgi:hypothetical protein
MAQILPCKSCLFSSYDAGALDVLGGFFSVRRFGALDTGELLPRLGKVGPRRHSFGLDSWSSDIDERCGDIGNIGTTCQHLCHAAALSPEL